MANTNAGAEVTIIVLLKKTELSPDSPASNTNARPLQRDNIAMELVNKAPQASASRHSY